MGCAGPSWGDQEDPSSWTLTLYVFNLAPPSSCLNHICLRLLPNPALPGPWPLLCPEPGHLPNLWPVYSLHGELSANVTSSRKPSRLALHVSLYHPKQALCPLYFSVLCPLHYSMTQAPTHLLPAPSTDPRAEPIEGVSESLLNTCRATFLCLSASELHLNAVQWPGAEKGRDESGAQKTAQHAQQPSRGLHRGRDCWLSQPRCT